MEMEQWWKRNSKAKLGNYTRPEVEDFTGCIPLLLDKCVVGGKIDLCVDTIRSIWNDVELFMSKMKGGKLTDWELYATLPEF